VDDEGVRFEVVKSLTQSKVRRTDMESAAKEVQKLLQQSVKERVKGSKKVAVAFSGGIDSSIIAFLAKNLGADVNMVYVSLENQPETEYAEKAAEELELPIHTYICSQKDVERVLPKVLWLVEEPDPVKISIGIPFFWAAEKTAKMNLEVLLAGQGADELFCGYRRYVNHYLQFGREKTRNIAFRDVCEMYKANFERDYKVCDFHNVELRLPFAAYQIMQLATELPLELKIERKDEGLRKLVLRRVAENIGLPRSVVEKPKKAIQYATGVSKVLRELAEREGLSIRDYLQRMFRAVFGEIGQHD
jgi:asparagine synthase (glutamine-hydrolysing)